jgi:hypothetical protein
MNLICAFDAVALADEFIGNSGGGEATSICAPESVGSPPPAGGVRPDAHPFRPDKKHCVTGGVLASSGGA